jgi:hypothetical protein
LSDNEKAARLHLSLSPQLFDRVDAIARQLRVSSPEVIRRCLARTLMAAPDDDR